MQYGFNDVRTRIGVEERDIIEFRNRDNFQFLLSKFTCDGENVQENPGKPAGKFVARACYLLLSLHVFPTMRVVPSFRLNPVTL